MSNIASSLENIVEQDSRKTTWRAIFRWSVLLITTGCLALSIVSIVQIGNLKIPSVGDLADEVVTPLKTTLSDTLRNPINQINDIFRIVALDIPLQVTSIQKDLASQFSMLIDSLNAIKLGNGTNLIIPTSDKEYAGGIGNPVFTVDAGGSIGFKQFSLIEHPSFIAGPTTTRGCTRIPTFHMSESHWCYSHNIIAAGCQDASASSMYISMGVLHVSSSGTPIFLTTASELIDDGVNRKSCSIVATQFGCDILCSIVIEKEGDDYWSDTPTPMRHGRFSFNGSFVETELPVSSMFSSFSANYPAVGSGEIVKDRILFPIYGGIKQTSPEFTELVKYGLFVSTPTTVCQSSWTYDQVKAAYRPDYISGRFWAQVILSCALDAVDLSSCIVKIMNSSTVMMAAEGRIIKIGIDYFYYQRSSSWWPLAFVTKLDPQELADTNSIWLTNSIPIPQSKFPRPSYSENYCTKPAVCPATCVTGVYSDIWPLTSSSSLPSIIWIGQYLDAPVGRTYPRFGIANQSHWYLQEDILPTSTASAYSTTTCFKNTARNRVFCVTIAEFADGLFGEYRITPQLYELVRNN
uniref:Hemagglutinin-neuraminidase n=1 Tax=avian paramyxovirus 8 TaxID=2560318 RepID=C3TWQ6_9MONO|nr:hemagglutinin-neuraminidase [Avian metaavulavirus 8]ACO48307.1 hemagglutinin-neuraminidase protein [Avian metaavulavirus 8]